MNIAEDQMARYRKMVEQHTLLKLIEKATIGTEYEEMYQNSGQLPISRYVDDPVLKFLLKEYEGTII